MVELGRTHGGPTPQYTFTVLTRFRAVAARFGERVAIVDAEGEWTFTDLLDEVDRIGAAQPRSSVDAILCEPRSGKWVAQLLAYWSLGVAPLLLDPEIPGQRLREVSQTWREARAAQAEPEKPEERLAYGITTSGSGGRPKIVEVTHGGLLEVLEAQVEAFDLGPGKRVLWMLSPGFDASLSDVGTALLSGATLVCAPDNVAHDLGSLLREHRITHCDIPPSLLSVYQPEDFPDTLETLVVGGAPSPPELLRAWAQRYRVVAVYGPTEATICSSLSRVDEDWGATYIGRPLGSFHYRVEDGELWISGPGLARGYAQDPEATARAFRTDGARRWYRTGDMVALTDKPHGLIFLGRKDRQIQRFGQRLELDEIERRLWPLMGVQSVAVVVGALQLWVFWEGDRSLQDAHEALERALPTAWIPRRWQHLESLPRTATGKLDRQELTRLAQISESGEEVGHDLDSLALVARQLERERAIGRPTGAASKWGMTEVRSTAEMIEICDSLLRTKEFDGGLSSQEHPASPLPFRRGLRPTMLLTGATGGFGRALTEHLNLHFRLVSLQRDPQNQTGVDEVIVGDLGMPRFGLSPATWRDLKAEVDVGFHMAAVVSSAASFEGHLAVNVRPLLMMSELTTTLHLASSLSVSLAHQPRPKYLGETSGLRETMMVGAYSQSKWIAERIWGRLAKQGVCLRYGQLLGLPRSRELLTLTVRGLMELGRYPAELAETLWMDITPMSFAVERTVAAFSRPLTEPTNAASLVAVTSGVRVSLKDLVDDMKSVGCRLCPISSEEFFALRSPGVNATIAQRAVSVYGLFLMSDVVIAKDPDKDWVESVRSQLRDYLKAATTAAAGVGAVTR